MPPPWPTPPPTRFCSQRILGRPQGGQIRAGTSNTFRAQTPQAFRFGTIVKAYELAAADPDFHPTDDTRVVVDYLPDEPVAIVDGSETNLKITTPSDMPIAEGIARSRPQHAKEEAKARMYAVFAEGSPDAQPLIFIER